MSKLLLIYLEGYLQSYGESSKWGYRDTALLPTKSAIVGVLGCALGIKRNDPKLVELSRSIRVGVRADRQGTILHEYQTITGELMDSNGAPLYTRKSKVTTRESHRQYLQDASFLVVVEPVETSSCDNLINTLVQGLKSPKWQIYLGRKNCVPTRPLLEKVTEEYKDIEDAMKNYKLAVRNDKTRIKYQIESVEGRIVRYDETLAQTGQRYGRRTVKQDLI